MMISASIGVCANKLGCEKAHEFLDLNFDEICRFEGDKSIQNLYKYFENLRNIVSKAECPIVIGGDHSCAIGTWGGIAKKYQEFGLIWVDAHMDSHTPETSITQNVHGMPAANLLGYGDFANLIQPSLKPENVVFIGIRSYEQAERELLESLGIKIFYAHDPNGLDAILQETFDYFPSALPLGITIDVDAFDPKYTPGVNTPEPGGLDFNEFIKGVKLHQKKPFCAVEIVEFNPIFDIDNITAKNVERLVQNLIS
jgi:arginase